MVKIRVRAYMPFRYGDNVAIKYNFQVHGTIGVILRAFREEIIDKKTAMEKVNELYAKSSLFITKDLVDSVLIAIEEFKR